MAVAIELADEKMRLAHTARKELNLEIDVHNLLRKSLGLDEIERVA